MYYMNSYSSRKEVTLNHCDTILSEWICRTPSLLFAYREETLMQLIQVKYQQISY